MKINGLLLGSFFFVPFVAWIWGIRQDPFFWDTVQLASKHAHFFYQNKLVWAHLPDNIDSGHPPIFGYFLAVCWTFFGKTLPVSHFFMLPFVLGIVFFLLKIEKKYAQWWLLVAIFDPVMAGQLCLVSPDVALICFFLMAIIGLENKKNILASVGLLGLCMISMRGMMTAGALFCWRFWLERDNFQVFVKKSIPTFSLGFLAAGIFLMSHYLAKGWIGHHPQSPWLPAFQLVDFQGFIKNIAVLGWRWFDLGRVSEWLILSVLFWKNGRQVFSEKWWKLWVTVTFCLSLTALFYQNLSAHRYFLPCFLAFHIMVLNALLRSKFSFFQKKIGFALVLVMFVLGNFWRYPIGISMDWDATLMHLPYHDVRAEMLAYIDAQNIDYQTIGSAFPNLNTGENIQLNGDERQFSPFNFEENKWVLWSNVFNDFSREDFDKLEQEWQLKKLLKRKGIEMRLYARP